MFYYLNMILKSFNLNLAPEDIFIFMGSDMNPYFVKSFTGAENDTSYTYSCDLAEPALRVYSTL